MAVAQSVPFASKPEGAIAAESRLQGRTKDLPAHTHASAELDDLASECVVCMDAPACVMLYPCGHNITCASCTRALLQHNKPCPFCSKDIAYTDLASQPGPWNLV